ncbi:hypothetical protein GHT06_018647 [Daphnia sinensis]|uniref:Uncharacterized protein n=1 Tax=Daphnia sinensis TaxID=1820382 RepID=A0AAD5PUW5_9CRUS|nr:hypothetical protein GHT06_018647 [Daphnia sinensis]
MTTKSLDIGKGAEFSLRALFDQKNLDVEPEEQCLDVPQEPVARKAHRIVFEREEVNHVEQQSYWKNAGMWTEPLFFSTGDTRFKEAVDFIHEPAKEEPYRDRNKWYEQREMLKQFYRNKMRRNLLWLAGTNQRTQQKRPLVDASDESSFQYFGQQDEIERQKKKKPHRTFFK